MKGGSVDGDAEAGAARVVDQRLQRERAGEVDSAEAVEPDHPAQAVDQRDRGPDALLVAGGIDAEEALEVERQEVATAVALPVGDGWPDARRQDQGGTFATEGDRVAVKMTEDSTLGKFPVLWRIFPCFECSCMAVLAVMKPQIW